MKIQKLLNTAAASCLLLAGRLAIQRRATHDPSDKNEISEQIEEIRQVSEGVKVVANAYGPILQSAIELGTLGVTHRIVVQSRPAFVDKPNSNWVVVAVHEFMGKQT